MKIQVKFILILTVLSGLSLFCEAVSIGQILGQVTEKETNKPVAFAKIVFENKMDKIEVDANEYGYYYANHIPTGKYQMRVMFNNRTFLMNQVRIYDSYSTEINFIVSSNQQLALTVEIEKNEPLLTSVSPTDINLTNSSFNQPTQSLGEVLSMQPGVDVINGKVFIKGSDQVRFFIDGTPVMGQVITGKVW